MRVDAYNAVSQIYQANSASAVKKADGTHSQNDKLEFSQTAKSYQTAKAAVADASDVRADKVAAIKAQMAAGTYQVDLEAVADKIMGNMDTLTF